jgi:deazaflavin-dependent oxidoreductase (nitroreductase family)
MKGKPDFTWAELNEMADEQRSDDGPGSARWNAEGSFVKDYNAAFIEEFRTNGGKIEGEIGFFDFTLITARGAKTGKPRTVPVAYYRVADRLVILASMGGSHRHPPWYHNILANPEITVEIGTDVFTATVVVTEGSDRQAVFDAICEEQPVYRDYQSRTQRLIPVIELKRRE